VASGKLECRNKGFCHSSPQGLLVVCSKRDRTKNEARHGSSGLVTSMCAGLNGFAVCTQAGGLPPLLELMASRNGNLQHNAAFALYGLADNEDNIAAIVREGGVQCLQDCELLVQVTSSCCANLPCLLYCITSVYYRRAHSFC